MAQFTVYRSSDIGAPVLSGTSGSLLDVLDECLVDGYTGHPGAGWTRPQPRTGSIGYYQMPAGSTGFYLWVRDDAPGAGGAREARIEGWESITDVFAGVVTGSNPFPVASQGVGSNAYLVARKTSGIAGITGSAWVMYADSASMYFFVSSDSGILYSSTFAFGDFYALRSGSVDSYRCMIVGRIAENSATVTNDRLDAIASVNTACTGHFSPRSFTGTGTSITMGKHGDGSKSAAATALLGVTQFPNGVDNGFYVSPVWVHENTNATVRGRMRGFYHCCHAIASFSDGQTFSGSGDYSTKIFQMVKGSANAGIYCMEITNTLETN